MSLTINPLAVTTTTVAPSSNPSSAGQSVTFTATVTGSALTGTVQFTVDGNAAGSPVAVAAGQAAYVASALSVGTHSVKATYSGDSANAASTSSSLTQTVNRVSPTTALASSLNPSPTGTSVTFSATVTGSSPTGTVTFRNGTSTLGTGSLSNGTASFSTSTLKSGTHSVTAAYGGDGINAASTSPALTQTVSASNPKPALSTLSPSTAAAGASAFTLTLTGTGFTAASTVQWNGTTLTTTYVSATQLKAQVSAGLIAAPGTASVTVVSPAPGGGTSGPLTFTITGPALSSLSVSPTSAVWGTPATGTVVISRAAPAGGTTVTLTSSTAVVTGPASVTVSPGQTSATFPVTTHSVTASTSVTLTARYLTVSKSTTLTVKPAAAPRFINAGGSSASPFSGDSGYSGGSAASTSHAILTAGVTNPAPPAVYQTHRSGTFSYTLSGLSPGAVYTLRLHFAEFSNTASGKRVFSVKVNGAPFLTNFDIFASAGGEYAGYAAQESVTANTSGQVVVSFAPGAAGLPAVNGIELH